MPGGRPQIYTQGLADQVCAKLAEGISVRTVCLSDDMPCATTVFKWLREIPEFAQQYARAKQESADAMFEELMDIADDGSNDWMESNKEGNQGYAFNGEALQRSRLRVDTRKWALSKIMPKKYGDKITHAGDDENPLSMMIRQISGNTIGPADE